MLSSPITSTNSLFVASAEVRCVVEEVAIERSGDDPNRHAYTSIILLAWHRNSSLGQRSRCKQRQSVQPITKRPQDCLSKRGMELVFRRRPPHRETSPQLKITSADPLESSTVPTGEDLRLLPAAEWLNPPSTTRPLLMVAPHDTNSFMPSPPSNASRNRANLMCSPASSSSAKCKMLSELKTTIYSRICGFFRSFCARNL